MANKRITGLDDVSTDPLRETTFLEIDSTAAGSEQVSINNLIGGPETKFVTKEADFPAAVSGTRTLVSDTQYIIMGDVTTADEIDLNGASIVGFNSRNCSLTYTASSGALFSGDSSGDLEGFTARATGGGTAKLFDLDATVPGDGVLRVSRVAISSNMDIGSIHGYVFCRFDSCTHQGNTGGIEFEDITVLELKDQTWSSNNTGTLCSFTGAFATLNVTGGLYDTPSGSTMFDLSGITSVSSGQIGGGAMFSGAGTFYTGSVPANMSIEAKNSGAAFTSVNNLHTNGFADYNDAATALTPISPTASTWTKMTNDTLGGFTNTAYLPTGVTDLWDESANQFDFTQLSLGDQVDIRFDFSSATTSVNQVVKARLQLGIGGSPYTLEFEDNIFKTVGTYPNVRWLGVYMGDANTRDNPAELQVWSDATSTFVNNGFYIRVIRY